MGDAIEIGLTNENKGNIPTVEYYDKIYGEGRWKASTIISLGIGQGEFAITPLQLANITAIIANRGVAVSPHIVKREDRLKYQDLVDEPVTTEQYRIPIDRRHFDTVCEGMRQVVTDGTARIAQYGEETVCGKTGTAQNPHGDDHSIFTGFAPLDNPGIAVVCIIENGGYGSRYAAPIASLAMEKYLTRTISEDRLRLEKKMRDANLIEKELEKKRKEQEKREQEQAAKEAQMLEQ